jgi:type I restriction-modification system DNA methylase subunit
MDYKNNFQTPPAIAEYMAQLLLYKNIRTVLEPTPGAGALVRAATSLGFKVTAPKDFFLLRPRRYDGIIMNPPFSTPYANISNAGMDFTKRGLRVGYHILAECMKRSDNIVALMPWFTISDSDVRLRALQAFGLVSLTSLPRSTFAYTRIQTVVIELQAGYNKPTIFKILH